MTDEQPQRNVYFTAGDLKRRLENVDDDTPVYIQRIEDFYVRDYSWKPLIYITEQWPGRPPEYSSAFDAFNALRAKDINDETIFVIEAHY